MVSLASHLTMGKSPTGPTEPRPSGLLQPQGKMTGLGSCWGNVPACFGSVSREKALGSSGSSYLHGTIRKKNGLDPMKSPWLHRGANSQWRSGGAKGFLMFSSCSCCPWCSQFPACKPSSQGSSWPGGCTSGSCTSQIDPSKPNPSPRNTHSGLNRKEK